MTRRQQCYAIFALGGVVFVLIVLVGFGFRSLGTVSTRQRSDEMATCRIQARGLPAGHALAAVVSDLHFLVALPRSKQANRNINRLPPAVRRALLQRYADLSANSRKYSILESAQPATRKC